MISSQIMERPRGVADPQALGIKGISTEPPSDPHERVAYSVRDLEPRAACRWGLSPAEVRRISGSMHFLRRTGLPCWYAVLGDGVLDMSEAEARAIFSAATSYLVQAQAREGFPPYWLRVLESSGGLHSN